MTPHTPEAAAGCSDCGIVLWCDRSMTRVVGMVPSYAGCLLIGGDGLFRYQTGRRRGRRELHGVERALRHDRLFLVAAIHGGDHVDALLVIIERAVQVILQDAQGVIEAVAFGP